MMIYLKNYRYLVFLAVIVIFMSACSITRPSISNPTTAKSTPSLTIYLTTIPRPASTVTSTPIPSSTLTPTLTPTLTFISVTPVLQGTHLPESIAVITADNVDRLTLLARWGQGNPGEITYTPDGKYFVVGTSTGLYFYNPRDFSLFHHIEIQAVVSHLAISPDSQVVAAVATDKVLLYRISDWQLVTTIRADANSADFSPDGKTLIIGETGTIANPGYLQLYDASTGKILSYFKAEQGAWAVKFSPRGDYIATAGYVTTMWALDGTITDQHGPYSDGGHTSSVSFSPDGKLLAEGADYKLHIWHVLENGRLIIYRNIDLGEFKYTDPYNVAISPNGKLVAATFSTGAGVWDLTTGARVFDTIYNFQLNNGLAWSMDSMSIAIASNQPGIQVWDVITGENLVSLDLHSGTFSSLAWSPDGQKLAVGAGEGEVDVFNYQNGTVINSFGSGYILNSLAFSPNNQSLAVGYSDRIVNIWDINGTILHTLEGVGYGSTDVTFSNDGSFFAACSSESWFTEPQVRFWNTLDWSVEKSVSIGNFRDFMLTGFALAPDQLTGAISYTDMNGYWEDKIQIISIADGSVLTTLEPIGASRIPIDKMAYSPDGSSLAVLVPHKILVWQTDDWNYPYEQYDLTSGPRLYWRNIFTQVSIAWSADSKLLAVGLEDGNIQIINIDDKENKFIFPAHNMYVTGVAFSPDGRVLASISLDGTVRLWGIP